MSETKIGYAVAVGAVPELSLFEGFQYLGAGRVRPNWGRPGHTDDNRPCVYVAQGSAESALKDVVTTGTVGSREKPRVVEVLLRELP